MKKHFFIIPGFQSKAPYTPYKWLVVYLKNKGYDVDIVPIQWKYRIMDDFVEEFKNFYNQHKSEVNYVLGFSYGAVIAFMTAMELMPKKVFLCSLSPDFKEDLPWALKRFPNIVKHIGKRRIESVKTRSALTIAKNLTTPSVIFYGEAEGKKFSQLKKRCEETVQLAQRSKLIVVKNAPHKIDDPEYKKAIIKEIDKL